MIKKILSLILSFIFLQQFICQAHTDRIEFQTSLLGNIHHSVKSGTKPLSDFGLSYLHYTFPRTYTVISLQGNTRNYKENSKDTLNPFTGSLNYNQWMGSVSVRHYFKEEVVNTFNYFLEGGFHYTRHKAEGFYMDGEFGTNFYNFHRFKGVGFNFKAGSIFQFFTPWYVGTNFALYVSGGKKGNLSNYAPIPDPKPIIEDMNENASFSRFQIEVRVGYQF